VHGAETPVVSQLLYKFPTCRETQSSLPIL